ncbi:L,D-transpeptidase/peptidoglycan binding protein [Phycicoccus sp. MAQZ13P-2]|uniref:L,D-transpeptidase family protein n=1 Tax=Phycicoccus mangrovi TaxID=2840470 RepID=UPI001C008263|nr:L,D-transpeptidase family protein [Phycicoccus mangrovi]MBT9256837.1 L,D-transpeptidase/peptidoglycan binding protein [Phycicoccus mangrovi]MBT9275014.1 L,D-transpeptidase/peptidoglycan binding protein [Phycicoccus mangrovi]
MSTRRTLLLTAAVAVPLALGGAGTAYAAHYQDRALPGSSVGGVDVAGMTRSELTAAVSRQAEALRVTVEAGGTTRTVSPAELGYRVDVDATVDAVLAADHRSWSEYARSLVSSRDAAAVVTTDDATVQRTVAGLVGAAGEKGRDAQVRLAPSKKSFTVVPAVAGRTVDPASFQDVVERATRAMQPATAHVEFVERAPAVTTARAQEVADAANAVARTSVSISDGDEKHSALTTRKASWVTIPTTDGVLGTPTVDAKKVRAWVDSVATDAKRAPVKGLRYLDADGTVRRVVTEAVDGRTAKDTDALAAEVVAALGRHTKYAGTLQYTTVPAGWEERTVAPGAEKLAYPAAVGEKWIDVNLSKHTMTAYVGAKVVYGPISMVNGSAEKPTVTGTFQVYYKNPLMTMRGSNADGTNYETPDVPWSSFFHRGFALHGAPWRSTFGYSASHGCINLPVPVAKWVYDFATIGTTVTSHY